MYEMRGSKLICMFCGSARAKYLENLKMEGFEVFGCVPSKWSVVDYETVLLRRLSVTPIRADVVSETVGEN